MLKQLLYSLVLFVASACGLVVEIVAGRLIAPYTGMSLYSWTAIIAVVLAGLSAGHWLGGRLAGAQSGEDRLVFRLAMALGLASVTTMTSLVLLHLLSPLLLGGETSPVSDVLLLCAALFLLPSLFVGVVAPIVTKLAVDLSTTDTGPTIGRMYALGTLGSIAGTLSAGYLFISRIGSTGTILAVAATYAVLAVGCALIARRVWGLVGGFVLLLLLVITGILGNRVEAFRSACTYESDYFCIRIEDFSPISGRESALMVLDNLVHSINDRADPSLLYSPYIHFLDEFTRRRFFKRQDGLSLSAFFIGGGGYSLPRSWATTMEDARVVVAEIDPMVTQAAADRLWLAPAMPGLDIRHQDARRLLQSLPAEPLFDVIFGDAFHDISIPAHLVTREFHREIARRLRPNGFYALNLIDRGTRPRFLAAMLKTLRTDFAHVTAWVEASDDADIRQKQESRVTYVIVASADAPTEQTMTSLFGIARSWSVIHKDERMDEPTADIPILTDDFAPVDRLLH